LTNCTFPTLNQSTTGNAATATNPAGGGTFVTSSNIGSQSVSYASTAGNGGVTSVNGSTGAVTVAVSGALCTYSGVLVESAGVSVIGVYSVDMPANYVVTGARSVANTCCQPNTLRYRGYRIKND
jgi:hypothetical protein